MKWNAWNTHNTVQYIKKIPIYTLRKERVCIRMWMMKESWISKHSIMIRSLKHHLCREFNSIDQRQTHSSTVKGKALYKYGKRGMVYTNSTLCIQLVFEKCSNTFSRAQRGCDEILKRQPSVWFRINYCATNEVKISQWTEHCSLYTYMSNTRRYRNFKSSLFKLHRKHSVRRSVYIAKQ